MSRSREIRPLALLVLLVLGGQALAAHQLVPGRVALMRPATLVKGVHKGIFQLPTSPLPDAFLSVFDTTTPGAGRRTYDLPAGQWQGLGDPAGSKGWKYRGARSSADPCRVVVVKPTVIKYVCKGIGVSLTPPVMGDLAVVLNVGDQRYCARFGGTTVRNEAGRFKRKEAPAPAECLPTGEFRVQLGNQITVLDSGALGLSYFPDMGTSLLSWSPTTRLILTAFNSSYLVEGSGLFQLTSATSVLGPGGPGSFDNGYAGISAVYRAPGGTLYGFYHAEDQEDLPPLPGGIPGFYASVGLATSDDDGITWTKQGQVLTSQKDKDWEAFPGQADRGVAEPGAVVSTDGSYLYLFYTEHSRVNGRAVDICVARADLTAGPPLPGSFTKYYQGAFTEPGLGGADTPVVSAAAINFANALEGHVTYSAYANRYLMIFGVDVWVEEQQGLPPARSGLYYALSEDAITWPTLTPLIIDHATPVVGKSLSWEATVLWDDAQGEVGWLVYGYSPQWGSTAQGNVPHYMVARRFQLVPR